MHKILLALTGAAVSVAVIALPAYAASSPTSQDTSTRFGLTAGTLSITAPSHADLGDHPASPSGTFSGSLGNVKVTDNRGFTGAHWTASVSSSSFTTPSSPTPIDASNVSYLAGPVGANSGQGSGSFAPASAVAFPLSSSDQDAFKATGVDPINSATWAPTVTVTVPSSAVAGEYTGTITHSVA